MEQYTHLLIPSDPQFAPEFAQIPTFLKSLQASWNYKINWNGPHIPGIRLIWTTGEPRSEIDERTGKRFTKMPRFEKKVIQRIEDIPEVIEDSPTALTAPRGCVVAVAGGWVSRKLPITVPRACWPEEDWKFCCGISFEILPQVVCTSDWWGKDGRDPCKSKFGGPSDLSSPTGKFTHPMTRSIVEVPNSGNARFWIGFGFSDWLIPYWPNDLALLSPALICATENHFGVVFAQAGMGVD